MITFSPSRILSLLAAAATLAATAILPAHAQGTKALEKEWRSCEGGYYTGPREGRRNYVLDKYLWVVTPAFAKRFCMPESMVSEELKGAEAIAFRMVDGADSDGCSVDDAGKAHCMENSTARFEIYLPQSLNLPAANPDVKFFEGGRTTSDWHLSNISERISRSRRYEKGDYRLPPGEVPRFRNPFAYPNPGHRFGLIYSHEGTGRWPVSPIWEVGFRGDWIKGMDMLILEQQLGVYFGFEMDQYKASGIPLGNPQGQYLIVMDKGDSQTNGPRSWEKKIPSGHAHVIYLPHDFGQLVRRAAMKSGGSNWTDFINAVRQR
ncbi:hypothetical protein [Lacisediminimonas profundi]|uniref:hypothetical protein n=1 Tax=Lacisediminimonas profundi TaxID=2603856 RepID=UPI00124B6549|nr:hypothetical protein [Lacisediminimonas profundi]